MYIRAIVLLLLLYCSGEVMSVHDKLHGIYPKRWIDDTTKKSIRCRASFRRGTDKKDDATCNMVSSYGGMLLNGKRLLIDYMNRELRTRLLLLRITLILMRRGGGGGEGKWEGMEDDGGKELQQPARIIEVTSNRSMPLQGRYVLYGYSNSRPHYIKKETVDHKSENPIHLCWMGNEWNFRFHKDRGLGSGNDNCLAYRKGDTLLGEGPSSWFVKSGSGWVSEPTLNVTLSGKTRFEIIQNQRPHSEDPYVGSTGGDVVMIDEGQIFQRLWPVYFCHMLYCVCSGIAIPTLPFFILGLGASVKHLSIIVSASSLAQTIGSVVMSSVSDRIGRKPVLIGCLIAAATHNFLLSKSKGLASVLSIEVATGLIYGMKAVAQAAVTDCVPIELHPKYIGWLQASVGLGFVFGPLLVAALKTLKPISTGQIFRFSSFLPLVALVTAIFSFQETKDYHTKCSAVMMTDEFVEEKIIDKQIPVASFTVETPRSDDVAQRCNTKRHFSLPILLLVLNGFLLMFACSIEMTVYATFIMDNFGYGETVLSTVFALNGIMVGILQLFFITQIVKKLGKHITLLVGDLIMTIGMVGLSMVRVPFLHFLFFSIHILGYNIADIAIVSLISRYSAPGMQGECFGLNQAAMNFARAISPLLAGVLYERSRTQGGILPIGALPYLVGSCAPLLAMVIPCILYISLFHSKHVADSYVSSKLPNRSV